MRREIKATGVNQPLTAIVVGRQTQMQMWLLRQCRARMLEFASRFMMAFSLFYAHPSSVAINE
jgi:hypothetical protein